MNEEHPLDIAAWLSEVSSLSDASPDTKSQITPIKISQKRKRFDENSELLPQKHPRIHHRPLPDTALAEISPYMMNTPSPSVAKRASKKTHTVITPQTDATKPSYEAASRPVTATPSSSSGAKQTINEENVRKACAKQNMFFEDDSAYEKYPDFKAKIERMVFEERGSAMRAESLKAIRTWKAKNATTNEKTYFDEAIPLIVKAARGAVSTKKRTWQDEIVSQAKTFESDGLDLRKDCLFLKNILPLRTTYAEAAQQGVTTAKPDIVYGLQAPQYPDPDEPPLSADTEALIGAAPGVKHPFFCIDNKGSQHSIEAAENQSIRSGATMVAARRVLNRKARGNLERLVPEVQAAVTNAIATDAPPVNVAALSDNSVTTARTAIDNIALEQQANETNQEDFGADTNSFTFTCSWVPQMANLHVHWCERRPSGSEVYHMNLVRGYLLSNDGHVVEFRKDIHNILDWGLAAKRKETLKEMERRIARYESRGKE